MQLRKNEEIEPSIKGIPPTSTAQQRPWNSYCGIEWTNEQTNEQSLTKLSHPNDKYAINLNNSLLCVCFFCFIYLVVVAVVFVVVLVVYLSNNSTIWNKPRSREHTRTTRYAHSKCANASLFLFSLLPPIAIKITLLGSNCVCVCVRVSVDA